MNAQPSDIVTFGKYENRTVDELLADQSYCQWLLSQSWFPVKYQILHQTIVNRGAVPEDTPEHNALQVLFLDDEFCQRFFRLLRPDYQTKARQRMERDRNDRIEELTKSLRGMCEYENRTISEWEQDRRIKYERELVELAVPFSVELEIKPIFEDRGIDVQLAVCTKIVCQTKKTSWGWSNEVSIEIKPTVSDDYPTVLRQMRRNGSGVLFLEQYTGVGATREQFVKTLQTAGIKVVFREELND